MINLKKPEVKRRRKVSLRKPVYTCSLKKGALQKKPKAV